MITRDPFQESVKNGNLGHCLRCFFGENHWIELAHLFLFTLTDSSHFTYSWMVSEKKNGVWWCEKEISYLVFDSYSCKWKSEPTITLSFDIWAISFCHKIFHSLAWCLSLCARACAWVRLTVCRVVKKKHKDFHVFRMGVKSVLDCAIDYIYIVSSEVRAKKNIIIIFLA